MCEDRSAAMAWDFMGHTVNAVMHHSTLLLLHALLCDCIWYMEDAALGIISPCILHWLLVHPDGGPMPPLKQHVI